MIPVNMLENKKYSKSCVCTVPFPGQKMWILNGKAYILLFKQCKNNRSYVLSLLVYVQEPLDV